MANPCFICCFCLNSPKQCLSTVLLVINKMFLLHPKHMGQPFRKQFSYTGNVHAIYCINCFWTFMLSHISCNLLSSTNGFYKILFSTNDFYKILSSTNDFYVSTYEFHSYNPLPSSAIPQEGAP